MPYNLFRTYLFYNNNLITESNSEYCLTPHNTNGECILLPQCPSIVRLLKKKPLLPEDAEYLRRSGCGFEGMDPKICCPLQAPSPTTTSAPDEG